MNQTTKWVIGVIIAVVIVAIGYSVFKSPSEPVSTKPIKIGGLFDLTGDAAAWGEDESRAVRLAIDKINANGGINGRQIELIIEDAPAFDIKRVILAFHKLVNVDGVIAIIGPTWDDAGAALGPLADEAKIPVIGPDLSMGVERVASYNYLFSLWYPQDVEAQKLADFAVSRGVKRIDVLRNIDPFSQLMFEVMKTAFEKNSVVVVQDIKVVSPENKDFRTEILKLKQDNVDGVFLVFQDVASKCPAVKQLKELRFDKLVLSESSTETADCKNNLEGIVYTFPRTTKKIEELRMNFKAKYGSGPKTPAVPNAYDAATLLAKIIADGNSNGEAIQKALIQVKNFDAVLSPHLSFNAKGHLQLPSQDFVIKTIRDNIPIEIE